LTSLDSLLQVEGREEYYQPLSPAQTVSVGEPTFVGDVPLRLLRGFTMNGGMRWEESPVKGGRQTDAKGPHAHKNKIKHKRPPPEVADQIMTAEDRRQLVRAIRHRAGMLRDVWKPPGLEIPPLNLPNVENSIKSIVDVYRALWNWQDRCLEVMRQFRDETVEHYDFSSFENAFGGLARLESLRGPFYTACYEALQARRQPPESTEDMEL